MDVFASFLTKKRCPCGANAVALKVLEWAGGPAHSRAAMLMPHLDA
jgi:hypothetical protein